MRWLVSMALCVAVASPAAAQTDEDRASAVQLTRRAQTAYNEGRFQTAAELLEAAFAIFPEPTILYNLARSRDAVGEEDSAIEAYRRYLAARPNSDNAAQARARLTVLERRADEQRALEAAARPPPPSAEPPDASSDTPAMDGEPTEGPSLTPWPWVIAGLGAAALGTGLGVGAFAQSRADEASAAPDHMSAYPLAQEAWDLETAANVTLIVGGVVLLGGALWGILELVLD